MNRAIVFILLLALMPASAVANVGDLQAERVVEGLSFPVKMAWLGERDFLVNEKMGRLRLVREGQLLSQPLAEFDVKVQNEAGLLDVVLMPDFAESGEFLVSYTPSDDLEALYITKLRLNGNAAEVVADPWIELPSRAAADRHFAGTMAFDGAGFLYVSLGDLRVPQNSQNRDNLPGSVLRFDRTGGPAAGNPFGDENPVFAYGLRNPFGIFIDGQEQVFVVENGDDVADEINHVEAGKNYGWPFVEGYCDGYPSYEPCDDRRFVDPIYDFRTVTGPTALVRYAGGIEAFEGDLLVAGWHSARIDHFGWEGPGTRAMKKGVLFEAPTDGAGLTDVALGDNGALFVLESSSQTGVIYRIARRGDVWDEDALVGRSGCSQLEQRPLLLWALLAGLLLVVRPVRRKE